MTDWCTWTGKGNPQDVLDPANWKNGHTPPKRGASVFVPAGSRIPISDALANFAIKRFYVEPDPEGATVKTRIG